MKLESKIEDFSKLEKGWAYGDGNPISTKTIEYSLVIASYLQEYSHYDIDAFPGFDGEILIMSSFEEKIFEITIKTDLLVDFAVEKEGKIIFFSTNLSDRKIRKKITQWTTKWNLSDSFTQSTMIRNEEGLLVLHLNLEESIDLSQCSKNNVPKILRVGESAPILISTIDQQAESQKYSGSSSRNLYPITVAL